MCAVYCFHPYSGFCTPGIAVACHTALAKAQAAGKPAPTCEELHNALDGNLCRCTGYRPIIAACTVRNTHATHCSAAAVLSSG